MTKKNMIETLKKRENEEWELLLTYEELYGKDNRITDSQCSRWCAIRELLSDLEILE